MPQLKPEATIVYDSSETSGNYDSSSSIAGNPSISVFEFRTEANDTRLRRLELDDSVPSEPRLVEVDSLSLTRYIKVQQPYGVSMDVVGQDVVVHLDGREMTSGYDSDDSQQLEWIDQDLSVYWLGSVPFVDTAAPGERLLLRENGDLLKVKFVDGESPSMIIMGVSPMTVSLVPPNAPPNFEFVDRAGYYNIRVLGRYLFFTNNRGGSSLLVDLDNGNPRWFDTYDAGFANTVYRNEVVISGGLNVAILQSHNGELRGVEYKVNAEDETLSSVAAISTGLYLFHSERQFIFVDVDDGVYRYPTGDLTYSSQLYPINHYEWWSVEEVEEVEGAGGRASHRVVRYKLVDNKRSITL